MKKQYFLSKGILIFNCLLLFSLSFWFLSCSKNPLLNEQEIPKNSETEVLTLPFSIVDAEFQDKGLRLVVRANADFLSCEFALKKLGQKSLFAFEEKEVKKGEVVVFNFPFKENKKKKNEFEVLKKVKLFEVLK